MTTETTSWCPHWSLEQCVSVVIVKIRMRCCMCGQVVQDSNGFIGWNQFAFDDVDAFAMTVK